MNTPLRIGLFGFGCVGQGLYDVLQRTPGLRSEITRICVKDRSKVRPLDASVFTYNASDVLDDPEIDVIVELISDADAALDIVRTAMRNGKSVVSANKRMIATNLAELIALQDETGQSLLYEASTCGSIPIIRNLEEYYDNDLLGRVSGIVNGTTNFILTSLTTTDGTGRSYDDALREAQGLGFAERDPTADVEAYDGAYKTVILAAHAFGVVIDPSCVVRRGITTVDALDIRFAASLGCVIKLIAHAEVSDGRLSAHVLPRFVPTRDSLSSIHNEINAVRLDAAFSQTQLMVGRGAGGAPTASAVLSDISALRYRYRYEYRKRGQRTSTVLSNDVNVTAYVRGARPALEAIPWRTRRIDVRGTGGHYIIGDVALTSLEASFAFADQSTFVALLADE
jgi:homoserine dehydrogenase